LKPMAPDRSFNSLSSVLLILNIHRRGVKKGSIRFYSVQVTPGERPSGHDIHI
jgi:hypothetical protein